MRFYFDTEFLDDGKSIDLISIGIVNEKGEEYYAVSSDFQDSRATDWLNTHVLAHIPRRLLRRPREVIARQVSDFLHGPGLWDKADAPEIWGWYPAYDWVALCQLYGPMMNRPAHFPKRPICLRQELDRYPTFERPKQEGTKHNALEDAKWVKACHEKLLQSLTPKGVWGNPELMLPVDITSELFG